MASKSPQRAQEIRDLARAICIRTWLDTDWPSLTAYHNGAQRSVGQNPERVWIEFPHQGVHLMIRYSADFDPPAPAHSRGGHPLINGYYAHNAYSRVEQIWWKMAQQQKSFAGMGLLGTAVEVLTRPVKESEEWAESIFAPYGVPPQAGYYEVTLRAASISEVTISGTYPTPEAAQEASLKEVDEMRKWNARSLTSPPQIIEVKKTK